jgi:hypothetical protein
VYLKANVPNVYDRTMWKLMAACSSKEGVMNTLEDLWNALQLHNAEDKAIKSKNFIP